MKLKNISIKFFIAVFLSTICNANTTKLKRLTLNIAKTALNKDTNTTITLKAKYSNSSTKELKDLKNIEWIVKPKDAVEIKDNILIAKDDKNTTIQAKIGNVVSNKIKLNIYWEADGHRLPPEPDPKINNSTLLGIDVNKNGVRDDVERWIYNKYKNKHPIHINIAMQIGKASQKILSNESMDKTLAKKIHNIEVTGLICESYYKIYAKYFDERILIHENIATGEIESIYFNTKKRKKLYDKYSKLLSGDSYTTPPVDKNMTSYCDFNTSKYEE